MTDEYADAVAYLALCDLVKRAVEVTITAEGETDAPNAFSLRVVSPECERVYFGATIAKALAEEFQAARGSGHDGSDMIGDGCAECRGTGSIGDPAFTGIHVRDGNSMMPCPYCGGTGAHHDDRRTP